MAVVTLLSSATANGPGTALDCQNSSVTSAVAEGTFIWTSRGLVPIECVEAGDEVLTHSGRFCSVAATQRIGPIDRVLEIKATGRLPLFLAPHTSILCCTWRSRCRRVAGEFKNNIECGEWTWVSANSLLGRENEYALASSFPTQILDADVIDLFPYCPTSYEICDDGFLRAKVWNAVLGKRTNHPRHNPMMRYVPLTPEFMMLCGYYVAEGCNGGHELVFAGHKKEVHIRDWCLSVLDSLGAKTYVKEIEPNSFVIRVSSMPLCGFFGSFGKSTDRAFPHWMLIFASRKAKTVACGLFVGRWFFYENIPEGWACGDYHFPNIGISSVGYACKMWI